METSTRHPLLWTRSLFSILKHHCVLVWALKSVRIHCFGKLNENPFVGNRNFWLDRMIMQPLTASYNVKILNQNHWKPDVSSVLPDQQGFVIKCFSNEKSSLNRKINIHNKIVTVSSFVLRFGKYFSNLFEFRLPRSVKRISLKYWFLHNCRQHVFF